jgi:AcrR family transcriptional regulator
MTTVPPPSSVDALLDAAFAEISQFGLARTSLVDVAKRAGVSRQTLYKHFANKDELVAALVLREEQQFLLACLEAAVGHDDLRDAFAAAIEATLDMARRHPLLDRLIATEPAALLPYLTGGRVPVVATARDAVEEIVASRAPEVPAERRAVLADAVARLLVSYTVAPSTIPVRTLAAHLAAVLVDGLRAPQEA